MSYGRPHKSCPGHLVIGGLQFSHPISTMNPMTSRIIGDLHEDIRIRTCASTHFAMALARFKNLPLNKHADISFLHNSDTKLITESPKKRKKKFFPRSADFIVKQKEKNNLICWIQFRNVINNYAEVESFFIVLMSRFLSVKLSRVARVALPYSV